MMCFLNLPGSAGIRTPQLSSNLILKRALSTLSPVKPWRVWQAALDAPCGNPKSPSRCVAASADPPASRQSPDAARPRPVPRPGRSPVVQQDRPIRILVAIQPDAFPAAHAHGLLAAVAVKFPQQEFVLLLLAAIRQRWQQADAVDVPGVGLRRLRPRSAARRKTLPEDRSPGRLGSCPASGRSAARRMPPS